MRRMLAAVMVAGLAMLSVEASAAVRRQDCNASVSGNAQDASSSPLAGATVRLRDANGQVVQTVTTDGSGGYTISGVKAGTYVLEVTDAGGNVIGSQSVTINSDCAPVTGLTVTGAAAAAAATVASSGSFFSSGAGVALLVAAAAGIGAAAYFAVRSESR